MVTLVVFVATTVLLALVFPDPHGRSFVAAALAFSRQPWLELAASVFVGCAVGAVVYTVSPIHDDAHFANAARQLAAVPAITRVYLKDPGGLLTPERARTL